jgi:hypothetical protein
LDRLTQEEVQHCKDNQQVEAFFRVGLENASSANFEARSTKPGNRRKYLVHL